MGKFDHTGGQWFADEADKGIQTSQDHRFYGLSAKLDKPYKSTPGKDLVIQYSVKHEQKLDCGGAYLKLLPGGDKFDADTFGGDTPYGVMFGPDVCGSTKRTHVILHSNVKDDNLLINKDVSTETNDFTHLYTLVVRSDNTFEVFVDNKSVRDGDLADSFDFLEPKEIKDPDASKPKEWVDEKKIPDPEDKKPDDWSEAPKEIPDPEATKPEDWDDEDDGEWEPPMVSNPDFVGEWKPKMIANPAYEGQWEHPMLANPDFVEDDSMYQVCKDECTHVGFELWQVTAGTVFDDIIVTDSLEEAQEFAKETFFKKKDAEKAAYDIIQDAKREAESADEDMDSGFDDILGGMGGMDDGADDEF
jgi:calreticulin